MKAGFPVKGYIFDLDGVLTDTAKFHYQAWKEVARSLNIPFSEADNENLKGISRQDSLDWILRAGAMTLTEEEKLRILTAKNSRYLTLIENLTPADLLPGLPDYLISLRNMEKQVILGSSSRNACAILSHLGILHLFDHLVDGNQVTMAKPDPEVFLLGARMAGLEPSQCLVFEDSAAGIEAALSAGMKAIGVGTASELNSAALVITGFDTPEAQELIA